MFVQMLLYRVMFVQKERRERKKKKERNKRVASQSTGKMSIRSSSVMIVSNDALG